MKTLIVANWKMNPQNMAKANKLFNSFAKEMQKIKKTEVVICPPFVYIFSFLKSGNRIKLGAQNCFWEEKGAFTGEISPSMLKNSGAEYVILGHSERRKYLKETDRVINKKIKAALKLGLKVVLCVDNLSQIGKCLAGLDKKSLSDLAIAYEPIFAIGTGKPCGLEKAAKARKEIRDRLSDKKIPILYGGSVSRLNARSYINEAGFQGLLVGGASLNSKEFLSILKEVDFS